VKTLYVELEALAQLLGSQTSGRETRAGDNSVSRTEQSMLQHAFQAQKRTFLFLTAGGLDPRSNRSKASSNASSDQWNKHLTLSQFLIQHCLSRVRVPVCRLLRVRGRPHSLGLLPPLNRKGDESLEQTTQSQRRYIMGRSDVEDRSLDPSENHLAWPHVPFVYNRMTKTCKM
jgi:hypothetical protein